MIKLSGTSILEIVIATAMITVAVIAALSLTNKSQSQNSYSRKSSEASGYASQVIDWARAERETLGWASLNTIGAGVYCLNSLPASYLTMTAGACTPATYIPNTSFTRNLTISKPSDTKIKLTISVTWLESTSREVQMESEIVQW